MPDDKTGADQTREYLWLGKLGEKSWLRKTILKLFSIDLRTLALTRVVFAAIVLIDLCNRLPDLKVFYSDDGVLPRAALREVLGPTWFVSLHFVSGRSAIIAGMFLLSAVSALALLIGYKTKLASVLTWLLFSSLIIRNPYVVHGGDSLLKMMLFWGIFLPWSASYSVDSALNPNPESLPKRVFSFATIAVLLQMPVVYFFTGILKNGLEWRHELTAIWYTFQLPDFVLPIGVWLSSYPGLLKLLTAVTLVTEIAGAVLLFFPFYTRTVRFFVCMALVLFQLGLALTLRLELFPIVSIAALLPFISSSFWDRVRSGQDRPSQTFHIYYDDNCGFCKKALRLVKTFLLLPDVPMTPAQDDAALSGEMVKRNSWIVIDEKGAKHFEFDALIEVVRQSPIFAFLVPILRLKPMRAFGTWLYKRVAKNRGSVPGIRYRRQTVRQSWALMLFCGFCLVFVVVDSLGSVARSPIRIPTRLAPIGQVLNIHQKWRMFAPSPLRSYTWYVVVGQLKNGREVDLGTGSDVRWEKPSGEAPWIKNERWRTYMRFLLGKNQAPLRPWFANYACRRWNESHSPVDAVDRVSFYRVNERINVAGPGEISNALLLQQECGNAWSAQPGQNIPIEENP